MMLSRFIATLEYLAGERDEVPRFLAGHLGSVIRCLVWLAAIVLIYVFSGQTSKFIYIDF